MNPTTAEINQSSTQNF